MAEENKKNPKDNKGNEGKKPVRKAKVAESSIQDKKKVKVVAQDADFAGAQASSGGRSDANLNDESSKINNENNLKKEKTPEQKEKDRLKRKKRRQRAALKKKSLTKTEEGVESVSSVLGQFLVPGVGVRGGDDLKNEKEIEEVEEKIKTDEFTEEMAVDSDQISEKVEENAEQAVVELPKATFPSNSQVVVNYHSDENPDDGTYHQVIENVNPFLASNNKVDSALTNDDENEVKAADKFQSPWVDNEDSIESGEDELAELDKKYLEENNSTENDNLKLENDENSLLNEEVKTEESDLNQLSQKEKIEDFGLDDFLEQPKAFEDKVSSEFDTDFDIKGNGVGDSKENVDKIEEKVEEKSDDNGTLDAKVEAKEIPPFESKTEEVKTEELPSLPPIEEEKPLVSEQVFEKVSKLAEGFTGFFRKMFSGSGNVGEFVVHYAKRIVVLVVLVTGIFVAYFVGASLNLPGRIAGLFGGGEKTPVMEYKGPATQQELNEWGVNTVKQFALSMGAISDKFPDSVKNAVYFGKLRDISSKENTGVTTVNYFGKLQDNPVQRNRFAVYIENLRELRNLIDLDVYEFLDKTTERERMLGEYQDKMLSVLADARVFVQELDLSVSQLKTISEQFNAEKSRFEADFFDAMEDLWADKAQVNLDKYIKSSQEYVDYRAKLNALNKIKSYYTVGIPKIEARIKSVQLNKSALIQGIRVQLVPGANIDLTN